MAVNLPRPEDEASRASVGFCNFILANHVKTVMYPTLELSSTSRAQIAHLEAKKQN